MNLTDEFSEYDLFVSFDLVQYRIIGHFLYPLNYFISMDPAVSSIAMSLTWINLFEYITEILSCCMHSEENINLTDDEFS